MATLTSIAPPPVVAAAPAQSPAPAPDARAGASHVDSPHRASFASALSHADGHHAAPRPDPGAATREDPQPTAPALAPSGGKAGGKKAQNSGGDDSPPDGNALPLVDAQLAAAANLPLPATTGPGPDATATAANAAGVGGAFLASMTTAPATQSQPGADAPATGNPSPATPVPADSGSAPSQLVPASGLVRPTHAVPTGSEFRAVTEQAATAAAPKASAPPPAPPAALPPPVPVAAVVAAVAPPPPKPAAISDEFSMRTTPWTPTPAGTDGVAVAPESPRALAPLLEVDTGNIAKAERAATSADGKPDPAALLGSAIAGPQAPVPTPSPAVAQVAAPVGSPDWPQQLGDRVAVLVNQNLTNAQLKLSPAHLGPLEIRIAVSDGQANIAFTSHSQVTREALEAAAPKLREMLSGQGFTHVNVDVSQQQFRDRAPQTTRYEPEFSFAAQGGATPAAAVAPSASRAIGSSLRLDAYA